jgi:uncharacterized membrane protein
MRLLHNLRYNRKTLGYAIVSIFFALYVAEWSHIALIRYYSLHSLIYDLGASMESMWQIYNPAINLHTIVYYFITSGIRLIFAPISLTQNYQFILVFQTIFIGASSILIYAISLSKLNREVFSVVLAGIYLIFPPLAGVNWYDFHFQAFFPFFFLLGYYFYLKRKWYLTFLFFFISGLVRYPYSIFPILFCIVEMVVNFRYLKHLVNRIEIKRVITLSVLLLSLLITTSISFYINNGFSGLETVAHFGKGSSNLFITFFSNIDSKFLTIILLLVPLLFLPVFSPRWYILYLPFFYLMFFSGQNLYYFPTLFRLQYGSLIIPFLFLGTIDGYKNIVNFYSKRQPPDQSKIHHLKANFNRKKNRYIATMAFIAILLSAFLAPYGPLHNYSNDGMNLSKESLNMTAYNELETLVKLIPANASSVIFQNNIPEGLPRPLISGDKIFVPGTNIPYNLTVQLTNGSWEKLDPMYIVDDPFYGNNGQFYSKSTYPYNYSMSQFIHYFGKEGYGVLGEASGMTLLEKGYQGNIKYYVPYFHNFEPISLTPLGPGKLIDNKIVIENASNSNDYRMKGFSGPYTTLSPGTYKISFYLSSTSLLDNDTIKIVVSGEDGKIVFSDFFINGTEFKSSCLVQEFTVELSLNNTYSGVEFSGTNIHWAGSLNLTGIDVRQVLPPKN